jgi:hypothetical protein
MNVISRLMRPQRVAVIGASADIASLPAVPDVGIVLFASGALEMDHFPSGAVSVVSQSGTFRVWPNFLLDEFPDVVFGLLQIEGTLQIEPELRRRIEVAGKP